MSNTSQLFASPADALRALFRAWPSDKGDGTGFAEAYIIAIKGYSLKAVEGAVMRLIRGEIEDVDKRFLPTPAQLGNLTAHMEKLYAPPERRIALAAPGDEVRTSEEQERVDTVVGRWREANGIKTTRGELVVDREAIPAAKRDQLDAEVTTVAKRIAAEGLPRLSSEALNALTPMMTNSEYEAWKKAQDQLSTPSHTTQDERAA